MPQVPKMFTDPTATSNPLGDITPGASQVMMAAATMHGYGRLLADGSGANSAALGAGSKGGIRTPRRGKGPSQRGQRK